MVNSYNIKIVVLLCALYSMLIASGCATPLAEGRLMTMEPVSEVVTFDANSVYYATKWAMDQCGYPPGAEDLTAGVIESKWVPLGAGSHYVDTIAGKDFGSNAAYYKMVIRIVPLVGGNNRVEAQTKVKSIVNNVRSTGDKEREMLNKIVEHARGNDITVTNLGVED